MSRRCSGCCSRLGCLPPDAMQGAAQRASSPMASCCFSKIQNAFVSRVDMAVTRRMANARFNAEQIGTILHTEALMITGKPSHQKGKEVVAMPGHG